MGKFSMHNMASCLPWYLIYGRSHTEAVFPLSCHLYKVVSHLYMMTG